MAETGKFLFRKVEKAIEAIDRTADASATIMQTASAVIEQFSEVLGVRGGRLYVHRDGGYELVRTFGKLSLQSLDCSPVLDLAEPVWLTAVATLPEIGNRTAHGWQLPSTWGDEDLQALAGEPERRTPLLLGVPRGAFRTVRYVLPPGLRAADLPAAVQRKAPFGSFDMQWRTEGDQVVIERHLALTASRIAPPDYAAFRDFAAAVRAADSQLVLLSRDGRR